MRRPRKTRRHPNAKRKSQAGTKNLLEASLDTLHKGYRLEGRALVYKIPANTVIEGSLPGGRLIARKDKAQMGDYAGTVNVGRMQLLDGRVVPVGLSVAGEAKSQVGGKSFDLGKIQTHQRRFLQDSADQGAVTWIYLRRRRQVLKTITREEADYLIPIKPSSGPAAFSYSQGRVDWADIEQWRIPDGKSWIDAVMVGTRMVWHSYCQSSWSGLPVGDSIKDDTWLKAGTSQPV